MDLDVLVEFGEFQADAGLMLVRCQRRCGQRDVGVDGEMSASVWTVRC